LEKDNDIFDKEYDDSSLRTDRKALPEEEEYKYDIEIEEERYGLSKPYRSTIRARIIT
jgi:hypothetical protein